jgi:hypothetical protein
MNLLKLWDFGASADQVQAVVRLKAAMAAARELGGCDFYPALEASVSLGRQLIFSGEPQLAGPGQALMLDTHTRLVRTKGELTSSTLTALSNLLGSKLMQPLPQHMHREAAAKARAMLEAMGTPYPANASFLALSDQALAAIQVWFKRR